MKFSGDHQSFFHGVFATFAVLIGIVFNFSAANDFSGVWIVPMKTGFLFEPTLSDYGFPRWASIGTSVFLTLLYLIIPMIASLVAKFPVTLVCFISILGLSLFNSDGIRQVAKLYSS
jgi:hypothetical protein